MHDVSSLVYGFIYSVLIIYASLTLDGIASISFIAFPFCFCQHNGVVVEFSYKVEKTFHHDTLLRQIEEATRIEEEEGSLLNDKMEFVKPFSIQLKATRMGH